MAINPLEPVRGQTAFALRQPELAGNAPQTASDIDALPSVEAKRRALAQVLAGPASIAPGGSLLPGHGAPTVAEKQAFRDALPERNLGEIFGYSGITAGVGQMMRDIFGGPRDYQGLGPARAFGMTGPTAYGGQIGRQPISGASRSVAGKVGGNQGKPAGGLNAAARGAYAGGAGSYSGPKGVVGPGGDKGGKGRSGGGGMKGSASGKSGHPGREGGPM